MSNSILTKSLVQASRYIDSKGYKFGSSNKNGDNWLSMVFLNFSSDFMDNYQTYSEEELIPLLDKIDSDRVSKISVFTYPLQGNLPKSIANHAFIIAEQEDKKGFWSFEKDGRGIYILFSHRGVNRLIDKDFFGEERDSKATPAAEAISVTTVKNIFLWLIENEELGRKYNCLDDNCQQFAQRLFNKFSNQGNYFSPVTMLDNNS